MKFLKIAVILFFVAFSSSAQLIMNEVLYDPSDSLLLGDSNGDGVYNQTQDEYIEFVNPGTTPVDVSKYKICDYVYATRTKKVRHTVANGLIIQPGCALIVFGGGAAVGTFGGATVEVDRGTAGLSLNNTGEAVILTDSTGRTLDSLNTDTLSDNPNQSYTRNPDITGAYVKSRSINPPHVYFSAGTKVDLTAFCNVSGLRREEEKSYALSVYPNPVQGPVHISFGNLSQFQIRIYDFTGKLIANPCLENGATDLGHLPAGTYILRAEQGKIKSATRIVIAK